MLARFVPSLSVLLICVSTALAARPAAAAESAAQFIARMGEQAVATVNAQGISDAERKQRFSGIFSQAFDVPVIARFALGRYWRRASEAEKGTYLKLFQTYIVSTYTERFKGYRGVSFKVGEVTPLSHGEELVDSTILRPGNEAPLRVQWRVRRESEGYRIVDVIAEGISMLVTYRNEFASIIARNGGQVSALIDELKRRLGQG